MKWENKATSCYPDAPALASNYTPGSFVDSAHFQTPATILPHSADPIGCPAGHRSIPSPTPTPPCCVRAFPLAHPPTVPPNSTDGRLAIGCVPSTHPSSSPVPSLSSSRVRQNAFPTTLEYPSPRFAPTTAEYHPLVLFQYSVHFSCTQLTSICLSLPFSPNREQKSKFDQDVDRIKELLGLGLSVRKIAKLLGYNSHVGLNLYVKRRGTR
jgi:hypothetical protein